MRVISNSSPLIALTQIDRLDLLHQLYACIWIPPAVASEVEPVITSLPDWILIRDLEQDPHPKTVSAAISPAEREVISLGWELAAALLILDEPPARQLAESLGFRVIGTVGLLLAAKRRELLDRVKPELDRLRAVRFFSRRDLYDEAVSEAGE